MGTAESKQKFEKLLCQMICVAVVVGLIVVIISIYIIYWFIKWFLSLTHWKEILIGIIILIVLYPKIVKYLKKQILKTKRMYRLKQMINAGKYDKKTKRIIIPIKPMVASKLDPSGNIIYIHLPYSDIIEATYCSSTTFEELAENAISIINNNNNTTNKKYILWDDYIKDIDLKDSIISKEIIDIIDNGLELKLINAELYDHHTVSIKINIKESSPKFPTDHIRIKAKYTESVTIGSVMEDVMTKINDMVFPTSYLLSYPHILNTKITDYHGGLKDIIFQGINIKIVNGYRHRIVNARITCKYLSNEENVLKCPIYKAMLKHGQYTENNLDHLHNFIHFKNVYDEQEMCKDGQICESHIRLQHKSNALFDRCHAKLYRHPPRTERQIKLSGTFAFIVNDNKEKNEKPHSPKHEEPSKNREPFKQTPTYSDEFMRRLPKHNLAAALVSAVVAPVVCLPYAAADMICTPFRSTYDTMRKVGRGIVDAPYEWLREKGDKVKYGYNKTDGFLKALIEEVIKNGYKCDLCLKCKREDLEQKSTWYYTGKCKHDVMKNNGDTLLCVADKKLQHVRHKAIGKPLKRDNMLALLLYTGGDCNYALCSSQRSGDYKTWKWFDYCLYEAIWILNEKETGSYNLYSGLRNVKMNKKETLNAYFVTYVSSSWDKSVAESFIRGDIMSDNAKGMLLEMDCSIRSDVNIVCCDVSWISKFESESEVLIARSIGGQNCVSLKVVDDDVNGVQIVSVKKSSK